MSVSNAEELVSSNSNNKQDVGKESLNFVDKNQELTTLSLVISTDGKSLDKKTNQIKLDSHYKGLNKVSIEKTNLVKLTKLVVKDLIENSIKYGRQLDSDFPSLQYFFLLLEHILIHGLKTSRKSLFGGNVDIWNLLKMLEKYKPEAATLITSIKNLPTAKTSLGRVRAWLRLALMQKELPEYFQFLVSKKEELLRHFYEDYALMMSEEAVLVSGLLVGLNVIDFNLCVKEEPLESQLLVIDLSKYLKEPSNMGLSPMEEGVEGTSITVLLDQKNYLEELNRHLQATVGNMQMKLSALQTENSHVKEKLASTETKLDVLTKKQKDSQISTEKNQHKLEEDETHLIAESQTYNTNQSGLDSLYTELRKNYQQEATKRQEVERELRAQQYIHQERETAMKLLEKDIHEKQDSIISLRRQLEDIKNINLQLYTNHKECDNHLKEKTHRINDLETKNTTVNSHVIQLEASISQMTNKWKEADEALRTLGKQLAQKDSIKSSLESNLKLEKEWRQALQKTIEEQKEIILLSQAEILTFKTNEKACLKMKEDHKELKKKCEEYEITLEEIGTHLKDSKLQVEELKESQLSLKEATWTNDKDAVCCTLCQKPFSLSRRKHHCRNCGEIYCHSCSDNSMPLPSSAKPVRVCDMCHPQLLQRYSAS